jgi:hypothetical protein
VFDAVPVQRPAPVERIAVTAAMSVPATRAGLAALASLGWVEERDGGWAMTALGRADRRATAAVPALALDWW